MIRCRLTPRHSLWVVAILGGMLFAGDPPTASASCGDYLHILPPGEVAPATEMPVRPCSGPGCQQTPPEPMPAPPPAPTTFTGHDAILTALVPPEPSGGGWVRIDPLFSAQFTSVGIFHPPRA